MLNRRVLLDAAAGLGLAMVPHISRAAEAAGPKRLPLDFFARRPLLEQASLSPDGKLLAAIVNNGKNSLIVARPATGGQFTVLVSTDNLEFSINWINWVNNERLVISTRNPSNREADYVGRFATTETRLFAVNADGSQLINLVKNRGAAAKNLEWAIAQDKVVDWLPKDGKHILLALPSSERRVEPAVFKVNVYTAERSTYAGSKERVFDWMTDQNHQVRVGLGRTDNNERTVWVCDPAGKNWRQISQTPALSSAGFAPMGFGLDPNLLYVRALHEGLVAVFVLDLREPDAKPQLKLAHPRYDLRGGLVHDASGEAVGVGSMALGDSSKYFWDERYKEFQRALDEALPNRFNGFYGASRDGTTFFVHSAELGKPESFFLGQFGEQPRLQLLAQSYPELQDQGLASKRSFEMLARDGMKLHGYLCFPPGLDAKSGKLPLVVFPHGGPHSSDGPEFDSWAAFMADRGCLVMQLNFRGSSGYGYKHLEAGYRQWGRAMQEDLEDGVAELVKRGQVDPARVVIVGGSYGGYAALMGLVKTPDLYRGAFTFAPVADLVEMASDDGQWGRREMVRRTVGDARDDKDMLMAASPCLHAQRIKAPVVLVHGTHDRVVEIRHSELMAEALKAAGKPCRFIKQDRGDHHLSHLGYRTELFAALEAFLAQTLGV